MKTRFVLILLLVSTVSCNAQTVVSPVRHITNRMLSPFYYSKLGGQSWGSGGSGVAEPGLPAAMFNNPACMDFSALTISPEFSYRSKGDFSDEVFLLPGFISAGTKIDNLTLGLGYANSYNYRLQLRFEFSMEPPLESQLDEKVHSVAGAIRYSSGIFSYGLSLGINYWTKNITVNSSESSRKSNLDILAIAGILMKLSDQVNIGLSGRVSSPQEAELTEDPNYVERVTYPINIELGILAHISPVVAIAVSGDYTGWSHIESSTDDIFQFHIGSIFSFSPNNGVRVGFYTQPSPFSSSISNGDRDFLTLGFQSVQGNIGGSLTMLDSHLFGGENNIHETIVTLGLSYSFK